MKQIVFILSMLFCTVSVANPQLDIVDHCGTLTKATQEAYNLTKNDGTIYTIISSEDLSINELNRFPNGTRKCVRAYADQADLTLLMLFDYWDYVNRESVVNCVVTKIVDDNVFEEGLSKHEYPNVYLEKVVESDDPETSLGLELSIGAMQNYEEADGDVLKVENTSNEVIVTGQYKDESEIVKIVMQKSYTQVRTKKAVKKYRKADLFYKDGLVAKLKCD